MNCRSSVHKQNPQISWNNTSRYCDVYHTNLSKKQEKDNMHKAKPEFKIKTRKLFQDKCSKQAKKELKDNAPYETNIGLNLDPNPDTPLDRNEKEDLTNTKGYWIKQQMFSKIANN